MISFEQFCAVLPRLPHLRAVGLYSHFAAACEEFQVTTPLRQAAFLAQLAHESVELRHFEELASGEAYEGRQDLGNVIAGDGKRFKGRGPLQLTGRANYLRAGKALGLDLVEHPRRASDADVAFRIAGWFWETHGCNESADCGDFVGITKVINGGLNGIEQRLSYFKLAKEIMEVV